MPSLTETQANIETALAMLRTAVGDLNTEQKTFPKRFYRDGDGSGLLGNNVAMRLRGDLNNLDTELEKLIQLSTTGAAAPNALELNLQGVQLDVKPFLTLNL